MRADFGALAGTAAAEEAGMSRINGRVGRGHCFVQPLVLSVAAAALMFGGFAVQAAAEPTVVCSTYMGNVYGQPQVVIDANVIADRGCGLLGAIVNGNLTVNAGIDGSSVRVSGNLTVNPNASCSCEVAQVRGTTTVYTGGYVDGESTSLGAINLPGGEIDLQESYVNGDVTVRAGGVFFEEEGSEITGNVVATPGALRVELAFDQVDGNVHVDGAQGEVYLEGTNVLGGVSIDNSSGVTFVDGATIGQSVSLDNLHGNIPTLSWSSVGGSVLVENSGGAGLYVDDNYPIGGDLQVRNNTATGQYGISVDDNSTGGSVSVHNNLVNAPTVGVLDVSRNSTAGGNLAIYNNHVVGAGSSNTVSADSNTVSGSASVYGNKASGPAGAANTVDVSGNTISQTLDCRGNKPPATDTIFGANTAAVKTGECASF